MPSSNPGAAIPVEALLKLSLDKQGSKTVTDFMDQHEKSWSRIESSISRVGQGIEGLARKGLALAGVAGIGAVLQNFMQTTTAGSQLGLAAGHVTGGANVWHGYGQSMLGAQKQTGVPAGDIAQGLISALQQVGGTPTPQQAGVIGGLLAGFGQTVGMSPSQVASVIGPLLQASHQPLNMGSSAAMMATVVQNMGAFPGSQIAPMLPLIASLAQQQAMGSYGAAGHPNVGGIASALNGAASANSVWRNPAALSQATGGIGGGLQGAMGNPSMQAFLQMAGVGYWDQRKGFTPANVRAINAEAAKLYPDQITRDMALRSMFGGIPGADLLETYASHPGALGQQHPPAVQHLLNQVRHAQAATTPSATANKAGGGLLQWIESSPLHALLAAGGAAVLPSLLKGGVKGGGSLLGRLLGGGADAAAGDAGASALGGLFSKALGPAGVIAGALAFPDAISSTHATTAQIEQYGVHSVVEAAKKKFGANWRSPHARDWMQGQLYGGSMGDYSVWGNAVERAGGFNRAHYRGGAGKMLDQALGDAYAGGQDPLTKFSQASDKLAAAADKLARGTGIRTSYHSAGGMGAQLVSQMGGMAPGLEFASLISGIGGSGGAGGGGGGGTVLASFLTGAGSPSTAAPGGGAGGPPTGGGWQPCLLTWYDPALGGINGGGTYADGGTYHASDMACAAPPQYPFGTMIEFTANGRTITCKVRDRGGAITGSHFDLTRGASQALTGGAPSTLNGQFRVGGGSSGGGSGSGGGSSSASGGGSSSGGGGSSSSGGGTTRLVAADLGGGGSQAHVANVHIHIGGNTIKRHQVKTGHKTVIV